MSATYGGFLPHDEIVLRMSVHYVYGAGVHGDIAEFGCFAGRTAGVLAEALMHGHMAFKQCDSSHKIAERHLWLFDSFEGFPKVDNEVDANCPHIQSTVWRAGIPNGSTPERVKRICSAYLPDKNVKVLKGWFNSTLEQIPSDTRFALVHLDCDYYESTKQVLTHLFRNDMVSDGCVLLFDDWYCNRGSPRFGQQKAWSELVAEGPPKGVYGFTDWGAYGAVGRKFLVHRD